MPEESKPDPPPPPAPPAPPQPAPPAAVTAPPSRPVRRWRKPLLIVAAVVLLLLIIPKAFHAWHTVSTDDAYVNSYVTFVAPRVTGQVARVLVEDNNRVKKGDPLVELDPEPYRVQVAIKEAAVDSAQAELVSTQATVRGQIGQTRALRFKLDARDRGRR